MADNPYVNKVTFDGEVLMDITDTTAEEEDVIGGQVFYTRSGARAVGTLGDATTENHGLMSAADKAKLDEFQDASNYITEHQDISGKANIADLATVATSGEYSDLLNTPTNVSAFTNDAGYLTQHQDISGKIDAADLATVATSGSYNDLSDKPFIPSAVSDLIDDSGHYTKPANGIPAADLEETYLTQHQDISMKANSADLATVATSGSYTDLLNVPTNVSTFTNDAGYLTTHQDISGKANSADLAAVATSGDYGDLLNKPIIPEVPVQDVQVNGISVMVNGTATISQIVTQTNGKYGIMASSGTLYTSPAGANLLKQDYSAASSDDKTKMVYQPITPRRLSEAAFYGLAKAAGDSTQSSSSNAVGIYTTEAKSAIQSMLGVPSTSAIPTLISQLTNDSGYLTSFIETDPTVPSWAKAAQKPSYTAAEVGAPTVAEMNTAIGTAIGNVHQFDIQVVQALPTQNIQEHTVYFVPKTGETNDIYDEYIYVNNGWEMIGNTQIDLSNYVQKTDYATTSGNYGLVKINVNKGLTIAALDGTLITNTATGNEIKAGDNMYKPIVPGSQHQATFYGLAVAAGDTTQSQSNNAVGTYTNEAKAAIRSMIGAAASTDLTVTDVQIDNTSIVSNGIASLPVATTTTFGVAKVSSDYGISSFNNTGVLMTVPASEEQIKAGSHGFRPLTAQRQHIATFYGLAKAAGDSTQLSSNNAVGTYTTEAKVAIQQMLDVPSTNDLPYIQGTGNYSAILAGEYYGYTNKATGVYAVAQGVGTSAEGNWTHTEGMLTVAKGSSSHAEGQKTLAVGSFTHAEGSYTLAIGDGAHIEGNGLGYTGARITGTANTTIYQVTGRNMDNEFVGGYAVVGSVYKKIQSVDIENNTMTVESSFGNALNNEECSISIGYASGKNCHNEGVGTISNANGVHTEGKYNVSYELFSNWVANTSYNVGDHVLRSGFGYECIEANSDSNWTASKWQYCEITSKNIFTIGNGKSNLDRSNALTVDINGNGHFNGNIYIECNNDSSGGTKVLSAADYATDEDIQNIINGGAGA